MIYFILVIFILYLLLIAPNKNRDFKELNNYLYTHRGLFNNLDFPENSLSAFKKGCDLGYGTELDVHLTKDNKLVVIHDSNIQRVTGIYGIVEDMTYEELISFKLLNTDQSIPLFEDVIKIYEGKCPIIIEIKTYKANASKIMTEVIKLTEKHPNLLCCYESFDPTVVLWLKKNRNDLIRGQLSYSYLKDKKSTLSIIQKFVLENLLLNFLTKPDFIAYDVKTKFNLSKYLCEKLFKTKQVAWTVKNQEIFDKKIKNELVIFEGFIPKR